eukprot:s478_g4.t1
MISDDDMEDKATAAAHVQQISEGLMQMTSSLATWQADADRAIESEQAAKRPRLEAVPPADGHPPDDGEQSYVLPKWTHPVLSEPNFMSEWAAIASADELAFEVGSSSVAPGVPLITRKAKHVGRAGISFDPWVELWSAQSSDVPLSRSIVNEQFFQCTDKPWKLRPPSPKSVVPVPRPASNCEWCTSDDPDIALNDRGVVFIDRVSWNADVRFALCFPNPLHPVWYHGILSSQFVSPAAVATFSHSDALFGEYVSPQGLGPNPDPVHLQLPFGQDSCSFSASVVPFHERCHVLSPSVHCPAASLDPLFLREAVSIPGQQCVPSVTCPSSHPSWSDRSEPVSVDLSDVPPVSFLERFFQAQCTSCSSGSERDHSFSGVPVEQLSTQPSPTAPPVPPVQQFARDILALERQGDRTRHLSVLRGLWVRIWYIHLNVHVRSFMARHRQLVGPPHSWPAQVEELWAEVIVPDDDRHIVLVTPTPPRNPSEHELIYDLILYQGAGGRYVPGIVTMSPLDPAVGRAHYSGAVAFLNAVDRAAVIEGISLTRLCQERLCTVRQGRTVYAHAQFYQMQAGLSHVVEVGRYRSVAAGSTTLRTPSSSGARPGLIGHRPNHSGILAHLSQLRDSGQLPASVVNVDELDACHYPEVLAHVRQSGVLPAPCLPTFGSNAFSVSLSCPGSPGDPLSSVAVSIPAHQCVCVDDSLTSGLPSTSTDRGVVPVLTVKLTNNTDPTGESGSDNVSPPLVPVPVPHAPPAPIILPAFVHDMFMDFPEMFIRDDLLQRGFTIRTWYLHHDNLRRTRVYRLLRLQGPPQTWQAQIIALWIDRILPLEALEIDLVKPTPPRDSSEQSLAFDVILSQGLHPDHLAGLVQVDPPLNHRLIPRFAMAATFPTQVSGRIIIAIIAFQQVCQDYRCLMFHRWTAIPLSHARVHAMNPGDSFLVSVQSGRPIQLSPSRAMPPDGPDMPLSDGPDVDMLAPAPSLPSASECAGSGTTSQGPAPAPAHVPDQAVDVSMPSDSTGLPVASSSLSPEHLVPTGHFSHPSLQRVLLYRLHHPVSVGFVRWSDPVGLVQDVISALGVSPVDVVALHAVMAAPAGQSPHDHSLIVQMAHDIPLAADEQLILVDVDLRTVSAHDGSLDSHFADRRVHKVPSSLSRVDLLYFAHVASYCEHMHDRCVVRVNHALWPVQDLALRTIRHGTYVQIELPAPTAGLPAVRTVQLVEDFPDVDSNDGFATVYPHWFGCSSATAHTAAPASPEPEPSPHDATSQPLSCVKGSRFCSLVDPPPALLEHVGEDDHVSAPTFSRPVGAVFPQLPGPPGLPPIHDHDSFQMSMGMTFRDHATVEFEDQGPILHVATWFVNHDTYPRCVRYVLVQLERDPATWPDTLSSPWRHLFQPNIPIAFRHVMPNPPRLFRNRHQAHVIIEQVLHHPRYCALFSILAQGVHHDSHSQLAHSIPQSLSAESALRLLDLDSRCRVYRCTLWSGVMQFTPSEEEPVFSGIGIYIHIHPPRFRHLLFDFGDQPFWHVSSSSAAGSSDDPALQQRLPSVLPASCDRSLQAIQDASHHVPHADVLFIPDLRVAWQLYLARTMQPPYRFQVVTWYCDHIRLPRSSDHRMAALSVDPQQWFSEVLQVWSDWVLPGLGVSLYVVNPHPRGAVDFVAHVIIAQNEQPECATVLISSAVPDENPWDPVHRVVKMPQLVDHHLLIHEGGLMNMCPPAAYGLQCQSWHGAQELTDGRLFLASSGDGFFIAASPCSREPVTLFEDSSVPIHRLFAHVADLLTRLVGLVTQAQDSSFGFSSASTPDTIDDRSLLMSSTALSGLADEDFARLLRSALSVLAPSGDLPCEPLDSSCPVSIGPSLDSLVAAESVPNCDRFGGSCAPAPSLPACCSSATSSSLPVAPVPSSVDSGPRVNRHPVILSLEAALPVGPDGPIPAVDCAEVPFSTQPNWMACLESTQFRLAPLPDGLQIHTETAHALAHPTAYRCPASADCIELYIDGSTAPGIAAWSLVVVRYDSQGIPSFCGCCAAPVDICPVSSSWIGAEWADNISAELSAVAVAQVLALSLTPCSAFVIRPDLQLSVLLSSDQCRCEVHQPLAQLVQWLGAEFHTQGGRFHEVRSHQGNPWNELADRLAYFSASQQFPVGAFDLGVCHELVSTNSIAWVWTQLQPASFGSCLPPSGDGITWKIHPSGRRLGSTVPVVSSSEQHAQLAIRVVSANVLALDGPSDPGNATTGDRVLRLARQWHARQCHVIGLQESRRPAGRQINEHYITFASGADTQHPTPMFGCELWLHRHLPWIFLNDGLTLTINDAKLVVAHADPRRLIVTAAFASVSLSFVVLHVPCRTAAKESFDHLQQWWEETKRIIRKVSLATFHWVCVDSNAPLASAVSDGLGLFGAEPMNPAGTLFEEACQELSWCAPCTFDWCHTGPHFTWTHPKGTKHRRDFVLTSQAAFPFACVSRVQTQHDGGFAHEDHLPTELSLQGWFQVNGCADRPTWDREAFRDPVKNAQFRRALHSLPIPTWDVNIDDHAHLFETQVLQLARQIFAPQKRAKPRPRLSEATVNLIAWKRSVLDFGRTHDQMQCPVFRHELRQLEQQVRSAVRTDQMQFYAHLVDDLADAGDLSNFKVVYSTLRRIGGRSSKTPGLARALPLLKDHSGEVVTTFAQQQLLWMSQFGKLEAGQPVSWDSLRSMHGPGLGLDPSLLNPDVIPTVADFLSTISKLKGGKAPGPNCLPPEICKIGSAVFAQHMAPLTLKAACHGKEPLSWRGGKLVALHKGKLPTWDPSGYRSIFVSDHTAKLYHSALRKHLVRTWEANLEHLQVGGRVGLGTDFAHHAVQSHWAHAVIRRQPAAIIFFDFQAAFYSVIRQGLFPEELDAQGLRSAMFRLGATEAEIDELLTFAHQDAALNGIDAHAAALLQDLFRNTFFTVDGVSFPCLTSKGTRPGDPVGDVLFNMSMRLILKDVTEFVRQHTAAAWEGSPVPHHDFTQVSSPSTYAWWEIAFVDDCAISVRADTNAQLLELIQLATAGMVRSAKKRGLVVNLSKASLKSCLTLSVLVLELSKNRLLPMGLALMLLLINTPTACVLSLHIVILVLGFNSPASSSVMSVFACPLLSKPGAHWSSLSSKVQVLSSLVMSRYCYNVHTWSMPDDGALREWNSALRPLLYPLARRYLRGLPPFQFGVNVLCGLLHMLPPEDQLHLNRLRYLPRMLRSCTPALWNLLCAVQSDSRSWLSRCQESFAWFAKFYGPRLGLSQVSALHDWIAMAQIDPAWRGKLRKAANSCVQFRLAQAEAEVWQAWLSQDLAQHGGLSNDPAPTVPTACWHCDLCDATFATSKQLAVHSVRTHGYRSVMKHFARDGCCAHCARDFHTRTRLCAHFRSKPDCLRHHQACFVPLTPEQLQELDDCERHQARALKQQGWLPTKALLPAVRVYGPALPPVGSPAAQAMLTYWQQQVPNEMPHAFQLFVGHSDGVIADEEPTLPQNDVIPGFLYQSPQGTRKGYANCFEMGGLARLAASLHISTYCFVHFYSGYRREGDLQHHIDHHWIQGTIQIFCLSVDFCIQRTGGDLSTPASREWWKARILSGAIAGVGGGPPCESYSAARYLPDGPVPLRSAEYIDGLPYNTARGWMQTLLGSRLMRFLIEMLLICAQVGACGFLEHPAYPLWIQALSPASVWLTQELKWMRRKPTTLFLVRMPGLIARLRKYGHQGRCHHRPGFHAGLAGKDSAGAFKTSVAKIYPSLLNQEIAAEVVSFVMQVSRGSFLSSPLPEEFLPYRCLDFVDHQVVQNDFHAEVMV